ncbi:LOW QUALITY PROTEIN: Uncharacterized protein PHPALM_21103 [Phytophthora palmivora]|uniref:Nuclease HARBI1 n=1 Tax=Phytophthora palmivora TaxID=4796 RepID=A0A2P4XD62_9STRA|nr:LOW QUALITY PROTEIN: Uncharacterized protein PHPALM_21103 [Phytophthora palmivora]
MPGSHNDINIIDRSHLFSALAKMQAPQCRFEINGNWYDFGYYLADYQSQRNFASYQEAARKDVERAFSVLRSRFSIVTGPARFWKKEYLTAIMKTCVILHNMIVEDERGCNLPFDYDGGAHVSPFRAFTADFVDLLVTEKFDALTDISNYATT